MGNEWDINMQTVIIVETELIVRNLPQHYGDERIKWFAHSRVGSPRILNQLGVFVDIKTRIGCPRPPLRTPQSRPVTGCVHPIKGQGWRLWTNRDPSSALVFLITSSLAPTLMTSGQQGARVWRTSHLLPRDASLFNTSSIFLPPNFRHLRVASDRDNSPPRLGE